jgi:hypothetical protein
MLDDQTTIPDAFDLMLYLYKKIRQNFCSA